MLVVLLVYQQVENNLLTPKIQGKAVNLSAFFIIVAVTLFGALLGVLGALTAVPLAATIQIFVQELTAARRARVAAAHAALDAPVEASTSPPSFIEPDHLVLAEWRRHALERKGPVGARTTCSTSVSSVAGPFGTGRSCRPTLPRRGLGSVHAATPAPSRSARRCRRQFRSPYLPFQRRGTARGSSHRRPRAAACRNA